MAGSSIWDAITQAVQQATGNAFAYRHHESVGGGCINTAAVVTGTAGGRYFVKLNEGRSRHPGARDAGAARNEADPLAMFQAEAAGLTELARARGVRVPRPICSGTAGTQAFLVLEYLELDGSDARAADSLGEGLARQHRTTQSEFGWERDNTIGSTPQINAPHGDWVTFYRDHRLRFQLGLAARAGYGGTLQRLGEELAAGMAAFFTDYRPLASLLHGDLWGGNQAVTRQGEPVVFDPAVYFGDREADIAMTELFGGFDARFYAAYRAAWPLDAGYGVRKQLYNLYHVLNHLNLFGGGYGGQAERLMRALLAETRG